MVRRLDDIKVGEYKSNWVLVFIYTLLLIASVVALFLAPFKQIIIEDKSSYISIVNSLIDEDYHNLYGYCGIGYICVVAFLFLNLFLCLSINKLGKSLYMKISKLIEAILLLGCLVFHGYVVYVTKSIVNYELFLIWAICVLSLSYLNLIIYHNIKKISIYD